MILFYLEKKLLSRTQKELLKLQSKREQLPNLKLSK